MLVSNHRSFFDQYVMLLACYMGPVPWAKRLFFPVRSNFFYDQPLGIVVNAAVAGGAMYPPIYRQAERRALNDDALDRMVEIVRKPGNVLGMHPEGTRGKGLTCVLRAARRRQVALVARRCHPAFILGLGNNIAILNFRGGAPRARPIRLRRPSTTRTCGEKPRPTLYSRPPSFMAEIG
jgi:1-acyl-sn-glycerol-3-phosphate acyltransferase